MNATKCNIAFAIDLFGKGILTKADTDTQGENLEWKNKGIPAKKELESLDLYDVWQDLEQCGYYINDENSNNSDFNCCILLRV